MFVDSWRQRHHVWCTDWLPGHPRAAEFAFDTKMVQIACDNPNLFFCRPPKGYGVWSQTAPKWDGEWIELWEVDCLDPPIAHHVRAVIDYKTIPLHHAPVPIDERFYNVIRKMDNRTDQTDQDREWAETYRKMKERQEKIDLDANLRGVENMTWAINEDAKQKVSETVAAQTTRPVPEAEDTRVPMSKAKRAKTSRPNPDETKG